MCVQWPAMSFAQGRKENSARMCAVLELDLSPYFQDTEVTEHSDSDPLDSDSTSYDLES